MGELLKDVMNERARAAGGPELDLDAIIANGDKRIRRTRIAVGVGVTAAVVAAIIAVPTVIDRQSVGEKDLQPANPNGAFVTRTTTYAIGTTIYYGDDAIDVSPHGITSLVQTDFGFVFTTPKADHQDVFFTDANTTTKIGETAQQAGTMLAADDRGSYVSWVDTNADPLPEFVVYDTDAGKEVARTSEGNKPLPQVKDEFTVPVVHAIDGQSAYWHSSAGTVGYDIADGTQQLLQPHSSASYLFDVKNGVFAYSAQNLSTSVNRVLGPDRPFVPGIGEPVLSPSGSHVMTMPQASSKIFETATQKDVTPLARKFKQVLLTQWIDDDNYAAIGSADGNINGGPIGELVCTISEGVCVTERDSIGEYDGLVFPVGGSLTDR